MIRQAAGRYRGLMKLVERANCVVHGEYKCAGQGRIVLGVRACKELVLP